MRLVCERPLHPISNQEIPTFPGQSQCASRHALCKTRQDRCTTHGIFTTPIIAEDGTARAGQRKFSRRPSAGCVGAFNVEPQPHRTSSACPILACPRLGHLDVSPLLSVRPTPECDSRPNNVPLRLVECPGSLVAASIHAAEQGFIRNIRRSGERI